MLATSQCQGPLSYVPLPLQHRLHVLIVNIVSGYVDELGTLWSPFAAPEIELSTTSSERFVPP